MTTRALQPSAVIVGAGLMGRWHLDAARRSGARVIGVVDRDAERARRVGGGTRAYESLTAALRQSVDVVHICTPLGTHVPLGHEAIAAGCHVIVEKPATPDGTQAAALSAAALAAGRLLVPVHQFVFQRGVQQIRARLPEFGTIRHFEFATASAGADGSGADGDTVAAEITPHALSLVRNLLGIQLATLDWHLERPAPGEWRLSAATDRGATITGLISMRARPTFASCRVLGERATATADLFHGYAVFEAAHASRRYKMIRPLVMGVASTARATANLLGRAARREPAYPGLRALCAATYAAMAGQGPRPFASDEITDIARARDALIVLATS
ncbi:MAG: Gfo/Idh/MocA family protein [Gemmatimonadales bacterium]